jgi:Putative zinc-finger
MNCHLQASGTIELYFYNELPLAERAEVQAHIDRCAECRAALDDLSVIRAALAVRPDVATPPGGDWSGFMARLNTRIAREGEGEVGEVEGSPAPANVVAISWHRRVAPYLAAAAVLALVTISSVVLLKQRSVEEPRVAVVQPVALEHDPSADAQIVRASNPGLADPGLAAVSDQHFERSKLVVLGIATKDAGRRADWAYERELAGTLLSDTRLYRLAAEERGMQSLAGVMRDLELVLLQASMSEQRDAASLEHLQRLIRRRDLITKMEIVHAGGR